jgi:hypothetical protein
MEGSPMVSPIQGKWSRRHVHKTEYSVQTTILVAQPSDLGQPWILDLGLGIW